MDRKHQNTERISAEDLSALVVWAQAMPQSSTFSSISKITDDDVMKQQPNELVVADDFNALKKKVAQLNAQVIDLTAVVDGLQESVEQLDLDGKKRHVSTENNQLSLSESSKLPAYISALKSLESLHGHELQLVLKNRGDPQWCALDADQIKRKILKQSGFGHFLVDRKT